MIDRTPPNPANTTINRALRALKDMQAKLDALEQAQKEPIAIIGMGCRFPGGANTPEAFWQLLKNGIDTITEIPKQRWDFHTYQDNNPSTRYGAFINSIYDFDADFFRITPREAPFIDPQQRLVLEVSWEAIEYAGINPRQLAKSPTGVFIGISSNDYYQHILNKTTAEIDAYLGTGNAHSVTAGRLSHFLDLTGPSLAIDTACSSSLVTVHLACQSLRFGEINLAIAGGVNILLSPEVSINFSKAKMLSIDGRCKTFDASANGYVRGEGCGIVILKRLSDATRDRDNILAIIRGSATNQDGYSSGLTVPNGQAQQAVILKALEKGKISPANISYVEAHGTGTALGDPIEVAALAGVFATNHSWENPLLLGSVKTNIGHLEAAAGIASLLKVILQLQHKQIAPHLNLKNPTSHINWEKWPLQIPTQLTPWQPHQQRLAGVSSFGFSGTNAHLVLEEIPLPEPTINNLERPLHLITLSAKTAEALKALVTNYVNYLKTHPTTAFPDICYTANTGRALFNHRLVVIAENAEELQEKLIAWQQHIPIDGLLHQVYNAPVNPRLAFIFHEQVFPVEMGRELYQTQPFFRQVLEQCEEILTPLLDVSILQIFYEQNDLLLQETIYHQTALFSLEYALTKLWQSWGVHADLVMGYGVGEYVAACVSGILTLEDALKLVVFRNKYIQNTNSTMQELALSEFESLAQHITYHEPNCAIAPNITNSLNLLQMTNPSYWIQQVKSPVITSALTIFKERVDSLLEIAVTSIPHQSSFEDGKIRLYPLQDGKSAWSSMLDSLAQLYLQGVKVSWQGFDQDYLRHKVILPTYPFQRQSYYFPSTDKPNLVNTSKTNPSNSEWQDEQLVDIYKSYQETMRQFLRTQEDILAKLITTHTLEIEDSKSLQITPLKPEQNSNKLSPSNLREHITNILLDLIAEHTGYSRQMLNNEQNLEKDLGIDSIMKIEILEKLQEKLPTNLQQSSNDSLEKLIEYNNIEELINAIISSIK